ncbi:hypothetical protein DENSPDRAFT_841726 [Dentipellis sp. KUC8613]|nr:hypothetical protein DENSPDRAFT_841726 [Dentipellis sp. KUC8613]
MSIVYEGLDGVDGSARFGFGGTKALASVSGPIEVRLAAELPSKATFEVLIRPLTNIPGTESKSLASALRALLSPSILLTRNPRTLIQLVVQSLTPNPTSRFQPALTAAFINASTLALLNAGSIPMSGVVCAVSVGRIQSSALDPGPLALLLDPTDEELASTDASGCFAFMFAADFGKPAHINVTAPDVPGSKLVWTNWTAAAGTFDVAELARATELAKVGAERVWIDVKESVRDMDRSVSAPPRVVASEKVKEETMDTSEAEDDGSDDDQMEI